MIYADNAAATRLSRAALEAMLPYLGEGYGNPSSPHAAGRRAKQALESARGRVAACLHANPHELTFTSGGSEADNQAIRTAAALGARCGKRHIVSTAFEHHAVLRTLDRLKRQGFAVTLLDVHGAGLVSPAQVAEAIREDTCLVTVMYANNEIGTVQPVAEIGAVCRERGVLFHTDAVQAAGQLPIDVKAQNIDLLSLSAHKFHGPKGVGALYARRGIALESLIEGGGQERGKRAGTENVPAVVGMAAALEEACADMAARGARLTALRERLIDGLGRIPYGALNGDRKRRLPGNVNFCFEGVEGEALLLLLDERGICASSGSACTSGSLDPSHVLLALGRPDALARASLRLTLGGETTQSDVDDIIGAVTEAVGRLRAVSPLWRELAEGRRPHLLAK